jgi:hypothetical protein
VVRLLSRIADRYHARVTTEGEHMGDQLVQWDDLKRLSTWDTLVLGNGVSINVWGGFKYSNLFNEANVSPSASQLFSDFETQNFETVLEALWHAERTLVSLRSEATDVAKVTNLYADVQHALFRAVEKVHVPWKKIDPLTLKQISDAMSSHRLVFTLNYDLLTYWSAMHNGADSAIKDFFWSYQNSFDVENAIVEEGKTGLFYLHGGLHLWQDSYTGRTGKWTNRSGGALLKNLEDNFRTYPKRQPVLVSEGTSPKKLARIRKSVYLTHALQALSNNTSDTVIFGADFADQDKHIFGAIDAGGKRRIAISVRSGNPAHNNNAFLRYHSRFPDHELSFFDSTSHPLGARSLTVP